MARVEDYKKFGETNPLNILQPWQQPAQVNSSSSVEYYADPLAETDIPDANNAIPVPLLIGRCRITKPNTIWTSTPETRREVTRTVDAPKTYSGGLSIKHKNGTGQKTTTGVSTIQSVFAQPTVTEPEVTEEVTVTTTVDFALGLCLGPSVALIGIYDKNDNVLYSTNYPASAPAGVEMSLDSYSAGITFWNGSFSQPQDPTILSVDGAGATPAYRGTAYVVVRDALVDQENVAYSMSFECVRFPSFIPAGIPFNLLTSDDGDFNVILAAYEVLTTPWGGVGIDPIYIDEVSLSECAQTVGEEGLFVSKLISNYTTGKIVVAEFMDIANGCIRWNPRTRQYQFVIFREDYAILSLPLFDESNVSDIGVIEKQTWQQMPRAFTLEYSDRTHNYSQEALIISTSAADAELANNPVRQRFDSIKATEVAEKVGINAFAKIAQPVLSFPITAGRDAAGLLPGDLIRVTWDYINGLVDFPVRVTSIREAGSAVQYDTYEIEVTQASFALKSTAYRGGVGVVSTKTETAAPPDSASHIDLPLFFLAQRQGRYVSGSGANTDIAVPMFIPDGGSREFTASIYAGSEQRTVEICPEGITPPLALLSNPISRLDAFDDGVIPTITVSNIVGTPNAEGSFSLATGLLIIGDEIFSYESFTATGSNSGQFNDVRRSLIDSVPQDHPVNSRVVVVNDYSSVTGVAFELDDAPTSVDFYGLAGFSSSLMYYAYLPPSGFRQRAKLPACPHSLNADALYWTFADDYPRSSQPIVNIGSICYFAWKRRNRLASSIGWRDVDQIPTEPTTYTVTLAQGSNVVDLISGVDNYRAEAVIPSSPFVPGEAELRVKATSANGDSLFYDFQPLTLI